MCLSLPAGRPLAERRDVVAADEPEHLDEDSRSSPVLRVDAILRAIRPISLGVLNLMRLQMRPVQAPVDEQPPDSDGTSKKKKKKKRANEAEEDGGSLPTIAWVAITVALVVGGGIAALLALGVVAGLLALGVMVALILVLLIVYVIIGALGAAGTTCANGCCNSLFSNVNVCGGCSTSATGCL